MLLCFRMYYAIEFGKSVLIKNFQRVFYFRKSVHVYQLSITLLTYYPSQCYESVNNSNMLFKNKPLFCDILHFSHKKVQNTIERKNTLDRQCRFFPYWISNDLPLWITNFVAEFTPLHLLCTLRKLSKMRENTDKKNSEYGHFSHSGKSLRLCVWPEWVGGFDLRKYNIEFFSRTVMEILQQILILTNDKTRLYSKILMSYIPLYVDDS